MTEPPAADDILTALTRIDATLTHLTGMFAAVSDHLLHRFGAPESARVILKEASPLTAAEKRKLRGAGPFMANPVKLSEVAIHPDQISGWLTTRAAVTTNDVLKFLGREATLSGQGRAGRVLLSLGWTRKRRAVEGVNVWVYVSPAVNRDGRLI
ncbi:MAG: hypothetical protein ABL951_16260 [Alphaproteobacteria bacterium]